MLRSLVLLPLTLGMECQKAFQSPTATFDLSKLNIPAGYNSTDVYFRSSDHSRPFTYFFNVCNSTTLPPECTGDKNTAAYQIVNNSLTNRTNECYPLGSAAEAHWTYVSGDNAAVGVQLTYYAGAPCRDMPGSNRKFTIEFACVHELSALPPVSTVHEDQACAYKLTIESIWGCPTECHSADHSGVCGGHGICAVDTGTKRSRCFCNAGKGGPDCTLDVEVETGSSSKVTAILVTFVILLLMALVALAGVLYVRIKKLNSDDNPYGAFDDQHVKSSDGL